MQQANQRVTLKVLMPINLWRISTVIFSYIRDIRIMQMYRYTVQFGRFMDQDLHTSQIK